MVRWWWPGNDVTDAELRREIGELDEAGFGGAEIQSYVMNMKPDLPQDVRERLYGFGARSFFAHVRTAVDEARSRGVWIDLSLGSGWPFGGGAAVTPERAITELSFSRATLTGPQRFSGKLSLPELGTSMSKEVAGLLGVPSSSLPAGWTERLKQRARTMAVVAVRSNNPERDRNGSDLKPAAAPGRGDASEILDMSSAVNLTSRMTPKGELSWEVPEGTWRLFVFRQVAMDSEVLGSAVAGPKLILDHFQRAAFDAFARQFGEPLQQELGDRLGQGLRALFCDSLEIPTDFYWSDDFLDEFRARRGYDLAVYLPLILQRGYNNPYDYSNQEPLYDAPEVGPAVRRDYWQTVGELITERLFVPFVDWTRSLKLQSRLQAHGAPADLLRLYGQADIAETENLEDSTMSPTPDFLRLAGSAGDLYGRSVIASESFANMGDAYSLTPEQIKTGVDRMMVAGVNQIIDHGYPYRYDDRPYPGWAPFATHSRLSFSSFLNSRNTFWPYLRTLNGYISRLQMLSQRGRTIAPIGIFIARTGYRRGHVNPALSERLTRAGYAYTHVNADALLKARIEQGELVMPGGARLAAVVLNDVSWLAPELARRLVEMANSGIGVIVIGEPPSVGPSLKNLQQDSQRVQVAMKALFKSSSGYRAPSTEGAIGVLNKRVPPGLLATQAEALPFLQKQVGDTTFYFIINSQAEFVERKFELKATGSPESWDAWTGQIKPFTSFANLPNGSKQIHLRLAPYESILLGFNAHAQHAPSAATEESRVERVVPVGAEGWQLHAIGLDASGTSKQVDTALPQLRDWSTLETLSSFSGRGAYTTEITVTPEDLGSGRRLWLDLGEVKDVAEIAVNGKLKQTLLMKPYRADITELVHVGRNELQIVVVNSLSNSMSGRRPVFQATKKDLGSMFTGVEGENKPKSAGLLGPVTLQIMQGPARRD